MTSGHSNKRSGGRAEQTTPYPPELSVYLPMWLLREMCVDHPPFLKHLVGSATGADSLTHVCNNLATMLADGFDEGTHLAAEFTDDHACAQNRRVPMKSSMNYLKL